MERGLGEFNFSFCFWQAASSPPSLPTSSTLYFPVTNVVWLFSKLPRRCVCVFFGKGLHTQRTVCLNFGSTRFTLSAVIMTQDGKKRGHPAPSHPLTLHDSEMTKLNSSAGAAPRMSLLPPWGGWASSQKRIPGTSIPFLFTQRAQWGAGLWAGSMIIPSRGSERSVVECSCH